MQRIAATTVKKLKQRQVTSIGSVLGRTLGFGEVGGGVVSCWGWCDVAISSMSLDIFVIFSGDGVCVCEWV